MFKRYWAKGLGLVLLTAASMLVGGFVLAGIGSHSALAGAGTTAPVAAAPASSITMAATPALGAAATPGTLRDRIIDMMKDHMGFTDQQASDWADTMTGHMQAVHGDWTGIMLDQMDRYMDRYVYGYGMMNGIAPGTMMGGAYNQSSSGVTPGTMMGWTTTTTDGTSVSSTATIQRAGTMMNGVTPGTMMGNTTTATGAAAAGGGTTPTTAAPQPDGSPGTMMGGTQVTPVTPAGTFGSMMNGATSGGMMGGSAGATTRTR